MPQSIFSDEELKGVFGTGAPKAAIDPATRHSGKTFSDDELTAHFGPSNAPPDTKYASAAEASRQAFERNLPLTQRTKQSGSYTPAEVTQPDPYHLSQAQSGMLRDYFLQGLEQLGVDPGRPLGSAAETIGKAAEAGLMSLPGVVRHPIVTGEKFVKTALGAAAAGPVQMREAQTPEDLARGTAQTTMFTYAPLRSAVKPFVVGTPEELMARGASLRKWEPIKGFGQAGDYVNAAVDRLKNPGARIMEGVARTKARVSDYMKGRGATPPLELPETGIIQDEMGFEPMNMPGFETPGPIQRPTRSYSTRSSGPLPDRSPTQGPRLPPGPSVERSSGPINSPVEGPALPTTTNTIQRGASAIPAPPPRQVAGNVISRSSGVITGSAADAIKAKTPLFFKDFKEGLSPEAAQSYNANLNNMARDAQQIFADQNGRRVLDEVDKIVGGAANRQKMLSTPTGENIISNFVRAMRQGDAQQLMRHGKLMGEEGLRTARRTIIPPPPG
jgi:hypothetical protein